MNLPSLYARVVAKRPELAVKDLTPPIPGVRSYWLLPNFLADDTDGDSIAAALILAKWVEALPVGHWIDHAPANNPLPEGWRVWRTISSGYDVAPLRRTPLEALAAFYLGDEQ